jgi:hypothetical protein
MINPSTNGWVDKFFVVQNNQSIDTINDSDLFYEKTRSTGFLVGYTTHFVNNSSILIEDFSDEEISKIALLNTLFGVYMLAEPNGNHTSFIKRAVAFYDELHPKGFELLAKILPQDSTSYRLEKMIGLRVKTNDNIISKNFSHILTNALLFVDVLAFKKFLNEGKITDKYFKKIEEIIVNIVSFALKIKNVKSKYDDLLQKLFESSVRYTKFDEVEDVSVDNIDLTYLSDPYEKYYLIDLATMAMWNDSLLEQNEIDFLNKLAIKLDVSSTFAQKSINDIGDFLKTNKEQIPYFNFSNPVKHFYDHTTNSVHTLIKRNKNRLLLEISQSKELMVLLAKSTQRDLNPEEKKKVKTQILDICKTIPSLTIFLVPGGSLLLPILIKFIPKLLPSAFNENLKPE